jgi:hypothetical protein
MSMLSLPFMNMVFMLIGTNYSFENDERTNEMMISVRRIMMITL